MYQVKRWEIILGTLALLCVGLMFVPECDDCYFMYWSYDSILNLLRTSPIPEPDVVVAVPANGRYLGNVLGVLLGKLYLTPLTLLRGVILGAGLIALTILLGRRLQKDNLCSSQALPLAFALVVFAPRGIWQQVYSWGAAWVNYLLPMLGILLLVEWWEDTDRNRLFHIGVISFLCSLFMEPITILLAAWGVVTTLGAFFNRCPKSKALALCVGSFWGTAVMFSAPGYAQAGNDTRSISLALLRENFPVILTQTLFRPALLCCAISALLLFLLRKQNCSLWRLFAVILFPLHLIALIGFFRDLFCEWEIYSMLSFCVSITLVILWSIMLLLWRGGSSKCRCFTSIFSLLMLTGPLLVVSPIGPRNFFPPYVCLCIIVLELYRAARQEGIKSWAPIRIFAAVSLVGLVVIYTCNSYVYHERLDYGRQQAAANAQELILPLLPFSGWAANEFVGKGDLSYLIYRETPWDVKLTFIPYKDFILPS